MYNIKLLLTAATLSVTLAAATGTADAAPWDHHDDHRPVVRHAMPHRDVHRHYVARERVFDTLRLHHYRGLGAPAFVRGHYVVRSYDRFGHIVFVEVDPYSGAFIGELRL